MSTEAEEDQLNAAMHASNMLTDDQTSSLTSAIRDVLSLEVEEEEDVSDIIEYAIAMIQNGKSVDYCTEELNGMGLLTSETIKNVGNILNGFLSSQTEEKGAKPSSSIIGNYDVDGTTRMAVIKASSKENALTMSGALSSARPGLKKEQKQQSQQDREHQLRKRLGKRGSQVKDTKRTEAGSDVVQSNKAAAETINKQGAGKQNQNIRKRSLASDAFNRLAKKNPKTENIGRQKPQQPQKQQRQQQQWRFEVHSQEDQEGDSNHKNKQQKQSNSGRRRNEAIHQKRNFPAQQGPASSMSQRGSRQGTINNGKKKHLMPPPMADESAAPDDKEEEQEFIPAIPVHNATSYNSNIQQLAYEGPQFYNHRGRRGGGPGRGFQPATTPAPTHWHTGLTYVRGATETTSVEDDGAASFHDNGGVNHGTSTPTVVHSFRGGRGGRFYGYSHSAAMPLVYEDVSKKIEQKKWVRPKVTAAEEKTTET